MAHETIDEEFEVLASKRKGKKPHIDLVDAYTAQSRACKEVENSDTDYSS